MPKKSKIKKGGKGGKGKGQAPVTTLPPIVYGFDKAGQGSAQGLETIDPGRTDKPRLGEKAKAWLKRHKCGNPNCYSGTTGNLLCEVVGRSGEKSTTSTGGSDNRVCGAYHGNPGGSSGNVSVRRALSESGGGNSNIGPGGKHLGEQKHIALTR